jgi:hypothetical protein
MITRTGAANTPLDQLSLADVGKHEHQGKFQRGAPLKTFPSTPHCNCLHPFFCRLLHFFMIGEIVAKRQYSSPTLGNTFLALRPRFARGCLLWCGFPLPFRLCWRFSAWLFSCLRHSFCVRFGCCPVLHLRAAIPWRLLPRPGLLDNLPATDCCCPCSKRLGAGNAVLGPIQPTVQGVCVATERICGAAHICAYAESMNMLSLHY